MAALGQVSASVESLGRAEVQAVVSSGLQVVRDEG